MGRKSLTPWLDFHRSPNRMIIDPYRFAAPGGGGASRIAGCANTPNDHGGGANNTNSDTINTTGATLITLFGCGYSSGGTPAITDSTGNTYTAGLVKSGADLVLRAWYCLSPTTSATHQFFATGGTITCAMTVAAFSGVATFDNHVGAVNGGATTSAQPGSITPANDNSLIVSAVGSLGNTIINSVDSSMIIGAQTSGYNFGCGDAYLIQGAKAAINPTFAIAAGQSGEALPAITMVFF